MPFLVDSVTMEVNRHGLTLHLIVHPVVRVERARGRRARSGSRRHGARTRPRANRSSTSRSTAAPTRRRSRRSPPRSTACSTTCAPRSTTGSRWRAKAREIAAELDRRAAAVPADEVREGLAFLAGSPTTTSRSSATAATTSSPTTARTRCASSPGPGSASCADRDARTSGELRGAAAASCGRYARGRELLVLTKANSRSTVHRPGYLDYVGVKRFDAAGQVVRRAPLPRASTPRRLSRRPGRDPAAAPQGRAVIERAGLPPASHAGKALSTSSRPIRATSCSRSTSDELFEHRDRHPAARRAPALAPVRAPRPLRALLLLPRLRAARPLQHRAARADAGAPDARLRRHQRPSSTCSSPSRCSRASASRRAHVARRKMPDGRRARARSASSPQRAAPLGGRPAARRWSTRCGEARGNALYRSYRRRVPGGVPRGRRRARDAVADIERWRASSPTRRSAAALPAARGAAAARCASSCSGAASRCRSPTACRCSRTWGCGCSTSGPTRSTPRTREPVWIHDFGARSRRRRASTSTRVERAVRGGVRPRSGAATVENDGFNRLVLVARARRRGEIVGAARLRQVPAADRLPLQPGVHRADARRASGDRAPAGRALRAALRPGTAPTRRCAARSVAAADRAGARRGSRASTRTASCAGSCALIQATLRTNYYQRATPTGGRKTVPVVQARSAEGARAAGAAADVRDLRLLAALRGRAPARRQGRARRAALVRPAARTSAPRCSGLMKAQKVKNTVIVPVGSKGGFVLKRAPAGADRDALLKEGIACYQMFMRGLLDVTDNIVAATRSCRRRTSCATTATIRTSWSRPTRARRRSPTSRTACRAEYGFWLGDAFASGGSAGYDHKKMGITARGAWECVKRHFREIGHRHADAATSPSPASATCRATCSATACCCRGTSGSSPRSTTATSSSTPSPIAARASPSASGCSSCRARPGPTTTRS